MMETAEDITQCSICKELLSHPRMLPCIHNFCLQCLQESALQAKKGPGDRLACHCCGKEFTVPPGGMTALQRSFFIEGLVEEIRAAKESDTRCDACLAKGIRKDECPGLSMMYCCECKQKLCKPCSEHHRVQKVSRRHHMSKLEFSSNKQTSSVDCCSLHVHRQLSIYCFECKVIICDECCKQTHVMHPCKPINHVIENSKQQIKTDLETLASHLKTGVARKEQLEMIKTECLKGFADVEAEVFERARKLKEVVDAHAGCLRSQLVLMRTKRLYEINSHIEEIKTCLALAKSFEIGCKNLSLKTSSLEICTEATALNKNAAKIQKLYESSHQKDIYSATLTLDISQTEECLLKMKNLVGEIREELTSVASDADTLITKPVVGYSDIKTTDSDSAVSASYTGEVALMPEEAKSKVAESDLKSATFPSAFDPSGIRLSTKLSLNASVWGITKLSHCIHVLVRSPNAIHVFQNQKSFKETSQIEISGIKKPHDIAASEKKNCLFVTDSETNCVWKVMSDSTITKWLSNIGDPFTLFMTPDLRLIMARRGKPSKIEIYKEDSSLDCFIQLPVNIEEPLHAVENSVRNFVVSHKWRECGAHETIWGITVTNDRGEILHRFFAKDNVQVIKEPQYLSVDSTDQVLVADFGNGRVVLLNSDLGWNKSLEIEDKGTIMYPKRLYLDTEKRQLLVGQYLKKGVHVYTF